MGLASFVRRTVGHKMLRSRWRKENPINTTDIGIGYGSVDWSLVSVGHFTYGLINVLSMGDKSAALNIGSYCSIAPEVTFIMDAGHITSSATTYPARVKLLGETGPEAISKGGITVGDDVWIGYRATILDGVTIGQGAIVAAGAVVAKDVPPYAVVGGVPAKVIRYRYPEDVVELMKRVDWSLVDEEFVRGHIDLLYKHPATRDDALELLAEIERHVREDK